MPLGALGATSGLDSFISGQCPPCLLIRSARDSRKPVPLSSQYSTANSMSSENPSASGGASSAQQLVTGPGVPYHTFLVRTHARTTQGLHPTSHPSPVRALPVAC